MRDRGLDVVTSARALDGAAVRWGGLAAPAATAAAVSTVLVRASRPFAAAEPGALAAHAGICARGRGEILVPTATIGPSPHFSQIGPFLARLFAAKC
jgi:hypothetical protein